MTIETAPEVTKSGVRLSPGNDHVSSRKKPRSPNSSTTRLRTKAGTAARVRRTFAGMAARATRYSTHRNAVNRLRNRTRRSGPSVSLNPHEYMPTQAAPLARANTGSTAA